MDDREVFFEGRRHQINRSRELADALVIGRSLYGVILEASQRKNPRSLQRAVELRG